MKLDRAKKTGIPVPNRLGSPFIALRHPRMDPARIAGKLQRFTIRELRASEPRVCADIIECAQILFGVRFWGLSPSSHFPQ